MEKINLKNITLFGIDSLNKERLLNAFEICEYYANFGDKILLTKINKNTITNSGIKIINVDEINSLENYSYFMIKKLNDFINTDYVLIIQYDGFILNPKAWTNDFLEYDYIGAPWWYNDDCNFGNGGFSLRSKKLLNLLQKDKHIQYTEHAEDHTICRIYGDYLREKGIKFAPEELAKKFSIEGTNEPWKYPVKYGTIWINEFGFHGLHKTDISNWRNPIA